MNKLNLQSAMAPALFLPLLSGLNAYAAPKDKAPQHPNILVIVTDQQSASMMSCAGNRWLKTPAMDAIASQGVRFTSAYATNPVCIPSRFSLQTGHYPSEINLRDNATKNIHREKIKSMHPNSMGNLFRKAGYDTYYGGKVHMPDSNFKIGSWGYDVLTYNERDTLAAVCADFLLKRNKSEKPFLLFASFINPHDICYDAICWATPDAPLAKTKPAEIDEALKIPAGVSKEEFFAKYCPPSPLIMHR